MSNMLTLPIRLLKDTSLIGQVITTRFRSVIGAIMLWYAVGIAVAATLIGTMIAPNAIDFITSVSQDVVDHFPQDVQIVVSSGTMQIQGQNTPITIPLSKKPDAITANTLAVFDTQAVAESITDRDTMILFSSKAISTLPQGSSQARVIPYNDIGPDFTITYDDVLAEATLIQEITETIRPWIVPLLFVAIFTATFIARLFFVLIYTLLISTIGALSGRNYAFQDYLKLSLLATVYAEVINLFQLVVYQNNFPQLFTIAFVGIAYLLTLSLPKTT